MQASFSSYIYKGGTYRSRQVEGLMSMQKDVGLPNPEMPTKPVPKARWPTCATCLSY